MLKQANIRYLYGGKRAVLESEYSIVIHAKNSKGDLDYFTIRIPKGFEYDGATIPRILWTFSGVTRFGYIETAALIHDYIYVNEGNVANRKVTRKVADKLFVLHMKYLGYAWYQRVMAYVYCRVFGLIKWFE